uniref:Uncharacterized protein n=1 Tax=Rhizophora mucronata TaxID=61149 RepID=A0A2P2QZW8_RHIMU
MEHLVSALPCPTVYLDLASGDDFHRVSLGFLITWKLLVLEL